MTKAELVEKIAVKNSITKKDSEKIVSSVFESITETLATGEKVTIVGFGTFEVRNHTARKGCNPRTKEPIIIPASTVPAFKVGKSLKDAVSK